MSAYGQFVSMTYQEAVAILKATDKSFTIQDIHMVAQAILSSSVSHSSTPSFFLTGTTTTDLTK